MHPVCVNSASVCRRALLRVGSQTRPGTERGRETVCRNRRSRFRAWFGVRIPEAQKLRIELRKVDTACTAAGYIGGCSGSALL